MSIEEFWQLIDATRITSQNNPSEQAKLLEDALFEMSEEDIIDYQNHLDYFMTKAFEDALWDAAYLIGKGCSEDGFMDFRAWLIGQGEELYELARQNPEILTDYVALEKRYEARAEVLLYVAHHTYDRRFGDFIGNDKLKHEAIHDVPSLAGCERANEQEFEDCLKQNYPKLWVKFGW